MFDRNDTIVSKNKIVLRIPELNSFDSRSIMMMDKSSKSETDEPIKIETVYQRLH